MSLWATTINQSCASVGCCEIQLQPICYVKGTHRDPLVEMMKTNTQHTHKRVSTHFLFFVLCLLKRDIVLMPFATQSLCQNAEPMSLLWTKALAFMRKSIFIRRLAKSLLTKQRVISRMNARDRVFLLFKRCLCWQAFTLDRVYRRLVSCTSA